MIVLKQQNIRIVSEVQDEVIQWISRNMRELDAEAIEVATGQDVELILRLSLKSSPIRAWAFEKREKMPLCVFGVCTIPGHPGEGIPWMLGSDYLHKYPVSLYRLSRLYIGQMKDKFRYLENWVYAKDEVSVKYLEHFGFTLKVPVPWGIEGKLFHKFYWSVSECVNP
ncbi:hypothetical protein LCGC14_0414210 [marine sediment metagenome]|uniref:N-acetyltransferase domain-containing protein n=1 Tax=marine sediment metagenome TaxID=412755 RepID=A0A0F9ST14_9ZZZZ